MRIGRVETSVARYDAAYRHFESADHEERNEQAGVATVCLMLGKMLWVKGSPGEALHPPGLSASTNNCAIPEARRTACLASLHCDRADLENAEKYYRKAIQLWNAIDDPRGVATGLCNLGATWLERGRVRKAIQAWQEALELATLTANLGLQSALACNLGEGLIAAEQFEEAQEILDKAADYSDRSGNPRLVAEVALNQATLHFKHGRWEDSVRAIEEARTGSRH